MKPNDSVMSNGVKFHILKVENHRMLILWTEKSGETKTRWVLRKCEGLRTKQQNNAVKIAA